MAQCTTAVSFGAPGPLVALGAGVGWECSLASACPLPSAGGLSSFLALSSHWSPDPMPQFPGSRG